MGIEAVDAMGAEIERRWLTVDYEPRHFSDICSSALAAAGLPDRIDPDAIVSWALEAPTLPRQETLPATFGQPPVTLFRSRRFYVEALFWIDGSTTIHQHSFSGAFQVLDGSSIETRYSFEPERQFDGHFVLGTLRATRTSLLRKGDIRPIVSGQGQLIHSLFHLDRPSVTIVARTFRDASAGPQFRYAWPGIGENPSFAEETLDRAIELVTMLRQIDHPELEEKVGALVARSDLHGAYRLLNECFPHLDRALFERLLSRLRDPAAVEVFRASFEETRRIRLLLSRRNVVKEPELRFFLGVLLNVHERRDALELVRARVPDRAPSAQVASWVRQLSTLNLKLRAAGAVWEPNMLGLPEITGELERALAEELEGRAAPPGSEAEQFLTRLRAMPALSALFD